MTTRTVAAIGSLAVALALVFVADQAARTLRVLPVVERERDTWQRPDEVLRHLDLRPGQTVVDLGSGAGYFALKMAPRVTPGGKVIAVDLRRQSLAFLWIRARRAGYQTLVVQRATVDDPRLPAAAVNAVLIANTFHEFAAPDPIMDAVFQALRPGGRLVVVDRAPRGGGHGAAHHDVTPAAARATITARGFRVAFADERFIDRPGDDDTWWLMVFEKPA